MKNKDIRNRLLLMMTNEAMRCLEDGTLQSPTDGDIGAILGLGFPPFTGGPFRYVDSIGADKAVALLEKLADKFGKRFTPADILYEYAQTGKKFYQ
jgi:3-hydroxyacyl-CoA dehydrogenase/enoyl-CoA hydratase/3-hydroxybutyryl-CoA epimerase